MTDRLESLANEADLQRLADQLVAHAIEHGMLLVGPDGLLNQLMKNVLATPTCCSHRRADSVMYADGSLTRARVGEARGNPVRIRDCPRSGERERPPSRPENDGARHWTTRVREADGQ